MTDFDNGNEMDSEMDCEFSRPVDVTTIGPNGRDFKITATDEEMAALTKRFSVLSLDHLAVECRITPTKKGEYKLKASFAADITQSCVVSLDPVEDRITGDVTVTLLNNAHKKRDTAAEIDFEVDEEDFEYITSNQIDVGELIAQHLSLAINPYPRKSDATGEELGFRIIKEDEMVVESKKKNPFTVLKSLKHKT